jgi:phosphatidylinositol alpha-1,6-mannosyltransferase
VTDRIAIGAATLAAGQGGIANVARMSAAALIAAGHQVSLISYLDEAPAEISGARSSLAARGGKFRFAALCQLAGLRRWKLLYDSAGIARAHLRIAGLDRPYAVWMHGIESWERLRPDAARALRQAALVLVNSQYTLERFRSLHGDLPAARVCWLATEDDEPAAQGQPRTGPPTAMILGRVDADENYKGHAELVAAWPHVVKRVGQARLMIAGGGSGLAALKELVGRSPAASAIDVLGFVPSPEMPDLWRRATVLAMPSRGEGFGIAYVEAMRHGLPVVASRHDAGCEVNVDGETGFNVGLDREGDLARAMVALLADEGLAHRMGEAGRRRWREHFSFSRFKERFLTLFAEFLR